jgi:hypothetical protein
VQITKMLIIAALAASSLVAPAFAAAGDLAGTGNVRPSYYDNDGDLHFGFPASYEQTTAGLSGLYAHARSSHGVQKLSGHAVRFNNLFRGANRCPSKTRLPKFSCSSPVF